MDIGIYIFLLFSSIISVLINCENSHCLRLQMWGAVCSPLWFQYELIQRGRSICWAVAILHRCDWLRAMRPLMWLTDSIFINQHTIWSMLNFSQHIHTLWYMHQNSRCMTKMGLFILLWLVNWDFCKLQIIILQHHRLVYLKALHCVILQSRWHVKDITSFLSVVQIVKWMVIVRFQNRVKDLSGVRCAWRNHPYENCWQWRLHCPFLCFVHHTNKIPFSSSALGWQHEFETPKSQNFLHGQATESNLTALTL